MAKDEAAVAAEVEVKIPPEYEYKCPDCDQPWDKGAKKCRHCGCLLMKNVLITKKS